MLSTSALAVLVTASVSGALALPTTCTPLTTGALTIIDTRDPTFVQNLGLTPVADADRNPFLQRGHDQTFTLENCGSVSRLSTEFNGTVGCLTVPGSVGVVSLQPCIDDAATQGWAVDPSNEVHFFGNGEGYHVAFPFLGGNQVVSEINTTPFPEYKVFFGAPAS